MSPTNGQTANGSRTVPVSNGKASYAEKHRLPEHFIGGNRLENAAASKIKDFVASHDGHTVITNVLIANNGIAAVKEIRSVRKWAYETFGDEKAIQFTVMATPDQVINNDGVPAPGHDGATGTFTFRINSDLDIICYDIRLEGVSGD